MIISPQLNSPSVQLVAPLVSFGRTSLALAGGKGANLGELLQAGFDVPPGFVVTTAAYDLLFQSDGLRKLLVSLEPDDPDSVARTGELICKALEGLTIPPKIAEAILNAYQTLGGAVAVRSSATAEDLPGAAFAGQQETYLNVVGEPALLDAVRGCWASLWSQRAVLYRNRQNVDQAAVKLAVVVQRMAPADAAGVMFTANPVSGERDELIIDSSPGLGEAVVGGLATPDHFVLDKRRLRLREQRIGRREVIVRPKAGGGIEQMAAAPGKIITPSLSTAALRQLAKLGLSIEHHYGTPQDVEWAWAMDGTRAGKFQILQARPMTALPELLKVKLNAPMRMIIPMLAEMWPVRPYPLDVTTFTGMLERAVGNFLVVMLGKSAPNPDAVLLEEDGVVVRFDPPQFHPAPAMLSTLFATLWHTRHNDPARWQEDPILDEVVSRTRQLEGRDLQALTWAQAIETLHALLDLIPRAMQVRERYVPPALVGLGGLWLLLALARCGHAIGTLIGGIETRTTETNRALETLAAQIRSDPSLRDAFASIPAADLWSVLEQTAAGQAFLGGFATFLAEYGHREVALTISQGAWKDRPEIVLGLLKMLAVTQTPESDRYQAWKRRRDELLAHSVLGLWPLRRPFLKALANARALFQIREDSHFYATLALSPVRRVALELGRRLQAAGGLVASEDVFHLRLEELEGLAEPWPPSEETLTHVKALVARRQAKRAALADTPVVDPRLLAVESRSNAGEDVLLRGTPGSPGMASGPARIVHDGSEFGKLQPGEILVAPVTNPAWTPLFLRAAGVVVDTGGGASHASIVAREYGVPAVMGTLNGTQQLTDGQWIRVDGSRGLVLKGENPNELK